MRFDQLTVKAAEAFQAAQERAEEIAALFSDEELRRLYLQSAAENLKATSAQARGN